MRCNGAPAARRGTLSRISVSSVRRPVIISGSAAFLAPEIGMVPLSLLPPTIRMRSMRVSTLMILGKYMAKRAIVAKAGNLRRFDEDKPVIPGSRHGAKQESQHQFKQYRDS